MPISEKAKEEMLNEDTSAKPPRKALTGGEKPSPESHGVKRKAGHRELERAEEDEGEEDLEGEEGDEEHA